jgi:ribokinase
MAEVSVLVAGAINTDLVARTSRAPEAGETVTGSSFAMFSGGKGANQAVAAARSGAITALLGAVGDDDFGAARQRDLAADCIDLQSVETVAGVASGVALISVEENGENRILYVAGATLTVTPEEARRAVERVQPAFVLLTLELPFAALSALVSAAQSIGATVVLNATPEPEQAEPLLVEVDILIVNEVEATALIGAPVSSGSSGEAAQMLRRRGPARIAITLGAAGAVIASEAGIEEIEARAAETVDTTGAGDTLCGAMVAALAHGETFVDAVKYGVNAASLAVTKAGAQAAIPTRSEVANWLNLTSTASTPGSTR